jgi:hypothetical protein
MRVALRMMSRRYTVTATYVDAILPFGCRVRWYRLRLSTSSTDGGGGGSGDGRVDSSALDGAAV